MERERMDWRGRFASAIVGPPHSRAVSDLCQEESCKTLRGTAGIVPLVDPYYVNFPQVVVLQCTFSG